MSERLDAIVVARGTGEGHQSVSVSTTTAATTNPINAEDPLIYSTVECFAVAGASPTATVATGTPIPALTLIRMTGVQPNDRLAFITATGTGTVYVCPNR
ncbi:hypothetical protein UFOVP368_12 [uncultured Caudovirales phage]|uniref:Uncharacterized protein n=1 Tax=uncultured Caudovirales phage TaxID=2100421 RepID=A0A6J7WX00_9CAUD|nr:hypothetical protein UFOVP368_12 [uncultured Caudovirales phage]